MGSLDGLVEALEAKAREYRAIVYDTAVGETAQKPLDEAAAKALDEIAGRVRQIEREGGGAEQKSAALKALAEELGRSQGTPQAAELPSIASLLFNPSRLFEMLGDTGKMTGVQKAAEIIKQYVASLENKG